MSVERRSFIKKIFLGALGLIGLTAFDIFWFEKYIIDWSEHDLSEKNKTPIVMIQLSDIHLKKINFSIENIAKKVNRINPDVLLFTGDTVARNKHFIHLEPLLQLFSKDIQKIVILGNKEYDSRINLEKFESIFKKYNGVLLRNNNHVFTKNKRNINILGVDDFLNGRADFSLAVKSIQNKKLDTVVLNHCPGYKYNIDLINKKEKINITTILSGHTHGGQITFFGKKIYTPNGSGNYLKGWYKNEQSKMYVSRGIGTTILPIRFFARAEASIFYV